MALRYLLPALCLLTALAAGTARGADLRVAAAANFAAPLQAIAGLFAADTGHRVSVSTASSGKLYAQIGYGAPFDVFLSADTSKPQALVDSGAALAGSRFTYALGRLALWGGESSPDPRGLLQRGEFTYLAIANPRLAPYGAAAQETLVRMGLEHSVADRLVIGENIAQALQFVASGNAQLGFVAQSQLVRDGALPANAWLVPADYHAPIRQDAVLLRHGEHNPAARAFLAFLRGPRAAAIMRDYGYSAGR